MIAEMTRIKTNHFIAFLLVDLTADWWCFRSDEYFVGIEDAVGIKQFLDLFHGLNGKI